MVSEALPWGRGVYQISSECFHIYRRVLSQGCNNSNRLSACPIQIQIFLGMLGAKHLDKTDDSVAGESTGGNGGFFSCSESV